MLVVSFGGPEGHADVMPFLANVTRGRDVPEDRLRGVAAAYDAVGGASPLNPWCRRFVARLEAELASRGKPQPVYWGNRNWHPMLADTVGQMTDDGVDRAVAFVTSAYSSYSGCRQYLENIEEARARCPGAPEIVKVRPFHDQPGFLDPFADGVRHARRGHAEPTELVFTAHSIPTSMAAGCDYERQLVRAAAEVARRAGAADLPRTLVYQSRSGPPHVSWLGPDISDHLATRRAAGIERVVVVPIGFVADHMEVVHDLDTVAAGVAAGHDLGFARVSTPGDDARFVAMAADLITDPGPACPPGCCKHDSRAPSNTTGS